MKKKKKKKKKLGLFSSFRSPCNYSTNHHG